MGHPAKLNSIVLKLTLPLVRRLVTGTTLVHKPKERLAGAAMVGAIVSKALTPGVAANEIPSISEIQLPPGYRDWRLISVAHEEGNLNDLRAILGTIRQFQPIALELFHFRTAQSLPGWPGHIPHRRKTTKSSVGNSLSLPFGYKHSHCGSCVGSPAQLTCQL